MKLRASIIKTSLGIAFNFNLQMQIEFQQMSPDNTNYDLLPSYLKLRN